MQKPIRRAAVQKLRITPQFVDEMQVHNILSLQWAADSRRRLQVFFSCIKSFSSICTHIPVRAWLKCAQAAAP